MGKTRNNIFVAALPATLATFLLLLAGCLQNMPPEAVSGPDRTVAVGTTVQLDGSQSWDVNDDELTYNWAFVATPEGSAAALSDPASPNPSFIADLAGIFRVQLIVNDGSLNSQRALTTITAKTDLSFDHSTVTGTCVSCHDGVSATGKSTDHIASTDQCDACHETGIWIPMTVDHTEVLGTCTSCHDGVVASGKSPNHPITQEDCGTCHSTAAWMPLLGEPPASGTKPADHIATTDSCFACHAQSSWLPVLRVDHTQVIGSCESCHNGVVAQGKTATHIASMDVCAACHLMTTWAVPLRVDHTEVLGSCVDCHNGIIAAGKSPNHPNTSDDCGTCHSTLAWLPLLSTEPPTTTKPVTHIPSTDNCAACHEPSRWIPVSRVDHQEVLGECVSCHNGVLAVGKSASHLVTTDVCAACHATETWVPVTVDHNEVAGQCSDCHTSPTTHVDVGINDGCAECHNSFAWSPAVRPLPTARTTAAVGTTVVRM